MKIKTQVCILGAGSGGTGCTYRLIKNGIKTVIGKDDFFFWDAGDSQIILNRSDIDCHTYVIGFEFLLERLL